MKSLPLHWLAAATAMLLAVAGPAQSCSDHEDPAVGRDRLAENFPGALDILPVVASARRERLLPPANPMAALWADRFPLQRHIHTVRKFTDVLTRPTGGAAPIAFAMVMIEPMLWTRYSATDGQAQAAIHSEGATPGELVLVSAEDVIAAIGDGRWTIEEAHQKGLLRLHGKPAEVARFLELYGGNPGARHADLPRP